MLTERRSKRIGPSRWDREVVMSEYEVEVVEVVAAEDEGSGCPEDAILEGCDADGEEKKVDAVTRRAGGRPRFKNRPDSTSRRSRAVEKTEKVQEHSSKRFAWHFTTRFERQTQGST